MKRKFVLIGAYGGFISGMCTTNLMNNLTTDKPLWFIGACILGILCGIGLLCIALRNAKESGSPNKNMSQRRKIGEVVQLNDEDKIYFAKIVPHGRGTEPDNCILDCGDPDCKEWPVLEVVDTNSQITGERLFHVSECEMKTPTQQ